MELYNAQTMPLSNNPKLRTIQEKIVRGESLSPMKKVAVKRDHPIRDLAGYKLKPDHCYRAVSERTFAIYLEQFLKVIELDRQKMANLNEQQ